MTNRSFSTWLLIALTALLVIGSLLPNPEYMSRDAAAGLQARNPLLFDIGRKFNSKKLTTGYLFASIGIYLIISATLCSIERLVTRRKEAPEVFPPSGRSVSDITILILSAGVEESCHFISGWLRRRLPGATITSVPGSGMVTARRGRFGFWGSILFHTVLIFALLGLVVLHLGGMRGKLVFTEGQRYLLERSRFTHLQKEPLWGLRLPRVELELLEHFSLFTHDDAGTAVEHVARFRVSDLESGGSYTRNIKINLPLRLDGKDFLLMTGGFSPRFVISGGGVAFDSCINLREETGTRDDFFPVEGLHIAVRFLPDADRGVGQPITDKRIMNSPAVLMSVVRQGVKLFDGLVPVGSSVQVAELTIAIPEVRRWVEVEMVSEPGMGLFFSLSFLGIFGVVLRVLDPDEQVTVVAKAEETGTRLSFFIESRHFSAILQGVAHSCADAARALGTMRAEGGER